MDDILGVLGEVADYEIVVPGTKGPTKVRYWVDQWFKKWVDCELFERFRVHKRTANIFLKFAHDEITSKTKNNRAISLIFKLQ